MLDFTPEPGLVLAIGDQRYEFLAHPVLPAALNEVWVAEGSEALVYRLREVASGATVALKVMKPAFRGPLLAYSIAALLPFVGRPGFRVAQRRQLTRAHFPTLLDNYPALTDAIVMPWVAGTSWASWLSGRGGVGDYPRERALRVASGLAGTLAAWEAAHLTHSDIAGGNIILSGEGATAEVIDCEHICGPGAPPPARLSLGSLGYQHPHLGQQGQWCAAGDRFAGAVVLTEMLTWWDERVRAQVPPQAETLFRADEVGVIDTPKWHAVRNALWSLCPDALVLFDLAWTAPSLTECPPLQSWAMVLAAV